VLELAGWIAAQPVVASCSDDCHARVRVETAAHKAAVFHRRYALLFFHVEAKNKHVSASWT